MAVASTGISKDKFVKKAIASLGAISLVLASSGVHAGTRASTSTVSLANPGPSGAPPLQLAESADGTGCRKSDASEKRSKRCEVIMWLAGSAWLLAFISDINRERRFALMPKEGVQPERDSSFGTGG